MSDLKDNLEQLVNDATEVGHLQERSRFIGILHDLGVIRNSMLGKEWAVIYTEDGPKDIKLDSLLTDQPKAS